jgi:hypothetical protein
MDDPVQQQDTVKTHKRLTSRPLMIPFLLF